MSALAEFLGPLDWMSGAPCADVSDPDLFFYENPRDRKSELAAKAVCGDCPVRLQCADYAVQEDIPYGVWGGMTPRERLRQRRELGLRPKSLGDWLGYL